MTAPRIVWLTASDPPEHFPPAGQALVEPDGLLAAGGDLSEARLLHAYRHGIFPWFDEGQPILWWSPDPRCIIRPERFHLSRRAVRALRNSGFQIQFNRRFDDIVSACSEPRPGQRGTWITPEMARAYEQLHASGWAHSLEVYRDDELVGGMYGLAIGSAFFGESMFSRETNASKGALLAACRVFVQEGVGLLDCQVQSQHLTNLGAERIARAEFLTELEQRCNPTTKFDAWPAGISPVADFL